MPFAPRPFEICQYVGVSNKDGTISAIDNFYRATTKVLTGHLPTYTSVTEHPLCFDSNKDILSNLGFDKSIDLMLSTIAPGKMILTPEKDISELGEKHFLQTGFYLAKDQKHFVYELSGRLHSVGLLFCQTPENVKNELAEKSFKSGNWMLDQAVFNAEGYQTDLVCDQSSALIHRQHLDALLTYVEQTNTIMEGQCYNMATSFFNSTMKQFDRDNQRACDTPSNSLSRTQVFKFG